MSSALILKEAPLRHDKTDGTEDDADDDIIFLLEKPACGDSSLAAAITNIFGTTAYIEWKETVSVAHILCSMRSGKFSD